MHSSYVVNKLYEAFTLREIAFIYISDHSFYVFFVYSQIRATYGISVISAICLYIEKKAVT